METNLNKTQITILNLGKEQKYIPIRTAILIPDNSDPQVVTINFNSYIVKSKEPSIKDILKTNMTDHKTITWFEDKNYMLGIFCKDRADKNDKNNEIGSFIGHTNITGNCLLYDDCKNLTMADFKKIYELTNTFDFKKYPKNCDESFFKLMSCLKNNKK
jgi:hypothetical protein